MTRLDGNLTLLLLVLLGGFANGQAGQAKEKAVEQMRHVAEAMKKCPEQQVSTYQDQCKIRHFYAGPPVNVEWDVLPSKTVRSPFQGIVDFSLPSRSEQSDTPNQSNEVRKSCQSYEAMNRATEAAILAKKAEEDAANGPELTDEHLHYEFDTGSDTPELVKMLWVAKDRKGNAITRPANQGDDECWVKVAKSIGSNNAETSSSPPKP